MRKANGSSVSIIEINSDTSQESWKVNREQKALSYLPQDNLQSKITRNTLDSFKKIETWISHGILYRDKAQKKKISSLYMKMRVQPLRQTIIVTLPAFPGWKADMLVYEQRKIDAIFRILKLLNGWISCSALQSILPVHARTRSGAVFSNVLPAKSGTQPSPAVTIGTFRFNR